MIFKKTANYWVPVLVILIMLGMTFLNMRLDKETDLADHFAPRWTAARSWMKEGWSPYSQETYQETTDLLNSTGDRAEENSKGMFLDPAWYIYLFIPISFVPYEVAKAIWMTLAQVSIALSILLAIQLSGLKMRSFEIILSCLLGVLFYPFALAGLTASMLPVSILFTLLAIKLAFERQGNQAGLLLLLAVWFNPVSLFIIVFLLIYLGSKRDLSLIKIFTIGFGFLLLTTLILFPGWIPDWFANIIQLDPGLDWLDTPWMGMSRAFPGASTQISIILHLASFIMLLVEWYGLGARNERTIQWKLMITLIVSYFFNLFSNGSAFLLVLPAFFTVMKYLSEKWPLAGKIITWISFLSIGISSWRLVTDPLREFPKEHAAILIVVPLLVFFGLQWFRWWAVASPKALVESKNINY